MVFVPQRKLSGLRFIGFEDDMIRTSLESIL